MSVVPSNITCSMCNQQFNRQLFTKNQRSKKRDNPKCKSCVAKLPKTYHKKKSDISMEDINFDKCNISKKRCMDTDMNENMMKKQKICIT